MKIPAILLGALLAALAVASCGTSADPLAEGLPSLPLPEELERGVRYSVTLGSEQGTVYITRSREQACYEGVDPWEGDLYLATDRDAPPEAAVVLLSGSLRHVEGASGPGVTCSLPVRQEVLQQIVDDPRSYYLVLRRDGRSFSSHLTPEASS